MSQIPFLHMIPLTAAGSDETPVVVLIESLPPTAGATGPGFQVMTGLYPSCGLDNSSAADARETYREQLLRALDQLVPLLRLARFGTVNLACADVRLVPFLEVLGDVIASQLRLEDDECMDRESSSPTCYYTDPDSQK